MKTMKYIFNGREYLRVIAEGDNTLIIDSIPCREIMLLGTEVDESKIKEIPFTDLEKE